MSCPCCDGEMTLYNPDDYTGPVPDVCAPCIKLHGNDVWPHAHGEGWRRFDPDNEPKTGSDSEYRWFDYNGGVYAGVNPFRRCQTRMPVQASVNELFGKQDAPALTADAMKATVRKLRVALGIPDVVTFEDIAQAHADNNIDRERVLMREYLRQSEPYHPILMPLEVAK